VEMRVLCVVLCALVSMGYAQPCVNGGFRFWRVSDPDIGNGRSCGAELPDIPDGESKLVASTELLDVGLRGNRTFSCASGVITAENDYTCTGPCASASNEWRDGGVFCSVVSEPLADGESYTANSTNGIRGTTFVQCFGGQLFFTNGECTTNCSAEFHDWRGPSGVGFFCAANISALLTGESVIVQSTAGPAGLVGTQNVTCVNGALIYGDNTCTSPCAATTVEWFVGQNTCSGSSSTQLADGATRLVLDAGGKGNVTIQCGGGALILTDPSCGSVVTEASTTVADTTTTTTAAQATTTTTTAAEATTTTTTAAQATTTTTAAEATTTTTAAQATTMTTAAQATTTTTVAATTTTATPATTVPATPADLNLIKDDCVTTVIPGGLYSYKFTVNNTGGTTAAAVTLTDTWPYSLLEVTSFPPQCAPGTTTIVCSLGAIAPGGSVALTIPYRVRGSVVPGTLISNCATASSVSSDSNLVNNDDCDLNTVAGCLGYDRCCAGTEECCPPLQCLRHASSCNGTVTVEYRCVTRGGSSITVG